MQVRLVERRVMGMVSTRPFSDRLRAGTVWLKNCHYNFQVICSICRDTVLEICCVSVSAFAPFSGLWLVDLHVYCRRFIQWPPCPQGLLSCANILVCQSRCITMSPILLGFPELLEHGLRQGPASRCVLILPVGLPHCRASPYPYPMASGIDRLPGVS